MLLYLLIDYNIIVTVLYLETIVNTNIYNHVLYINIVKDINKLSLMLFR